MPGFGFVIAVSALVLTERLARLGLAGACAGLMAAAVGALVYALHCPEVEAPFLAVWCVLGLLIPTVVGALIGPKLLRW